MKKVFAVFFAVILAFAVALGDQAYKMLAGDSPLTLEAVIGLFSRDKTSAAPFGKPGLPAVTLIRKKEETNLTYNQRIEKGDYYKKKGFMAFAANEYVKASNLEPKNITPYLKLADVHYDLMEYDKAKLNAEQVLVIDPQNIEAQYWMILSEIRLSGFNEADALIGRLSGAGVTDGRLLYLKGLIQIAFGQYDEAKKWLEEARLQLAGDPAYSEKIQKILKAYEEYSFAQGAENLYLEELLCRSLNQIGEYEIAIFKLKQILKTRSDLRDAWIMLGFAYLNLERYLFALTAFQQAYALDSQWPSTPYFLGVTYAELNKPDDAVIYLNYALNNGFEPKIVLLRKLADLYLDLGKYAESVTEYEKVLKLSQQDVNAFVRPIWIYIDFLRQPEKALKLGEAAVIAFPENPMAHNLLGWSQYGAQNYVEAEKNLQKAVAMDPSLAAAFYNLAKLLEETDRKEEALTNYQKAYELDQNGSIGNLAAKRYNVLLVK